MKISKELSSTLMVANLMATLLVIAVHYNTKGAVDLSNGFTPNYLFQEFLTNGIARSAVPLFALLSGFFIRNKVKTFTGYQTMLKGKVKTLLIPYILASAIIYALSLISRALLHQDMDAFLTPYSMIYGITAHPVSVHLWYLRDLLVLTLLAPLLFNLHRGLAILFCLGSFCLWVVDIQPFPIVAQWYLLNIETLFFFWAGGLLFEHKQLLEHCIHYSIQSGWFVLGIWSLLISLRIYLYPNIQLWYAQEYSYPALFIYRLAIMVGVVNLMQLASVFRENQCIIWLSGYTFFIYLFHFTPLFDIVRKWNILAPTEYLFYINFPFVTLLVFSIGWLLAKTNPRTYKLITGERSPEKTLQRIAPPAAPGIAPLQ